MVRATSKLMPCLVLSMAASYVSAGGMIAQVVDSQNFCVMLPPPGEMSAPLSDNEWDSQAYCMGDTPKAIDANSLPDGFIQSAHYVATDEYVQVTGQFDPTKIGLNPKDDGGQCDIMAPKGSSCAGWKYYVNLMEPSGNTYCMRCCNDTKNCNRGISEAGCQHIIPGDYSGPMNGSGDGMPTTSSSSSDPSPTHKTEKSSSTTQEAESTSSPDSDASPTTSSSSDDSASTSTPDAGSGSGSDTGSGSSGSDAGTGSETPADSSSSTSPQVSPSSSVLPPTGISSSSLPNGSSGSSSNASGSQSADLAQSSVTEQSVNQASSLTSSSIMAGGLVALVAMVVSA